MEKYESPSQIAWQFFSQYLVTAPNVALRKAIQYLITHVQTLLKL